MFGILLFAHLLGDYPLQTNWMVQAKRTWLGLSLHVAIHLLVLLILAGSARSVLWPYLIILAASHFAIDTLKTFVSQVRPQWINGPYCADQVLHVMSIWFIATWIEASVAPSDVPTADPWMYYATALLFATYVWFVSERLLTHNHPSYQMEVIAQKWPRMATRALLLAIFLGLPYLSGAGAVHDLSALAPLPLSMPYLSGQFRLRALVTDLAVTLVPALILHGVIP